MTLASERIEVPADPRALYDLALEEHWSDGVPLLPATDDAIEALLAATPYPADHVVCVLPPVNGVATIELVAINAAMAGCRARRVPVRARRARSAVRAGVERVRAHHHDVERVPDAHRQRPVP